MQEGAVEGKKIDENLVFVQLGCSCGEWLNQRHWCAYLQPSNTYSARPPSYLPQMFSVTLLNFFVIQDEVLSRSYYI